MARQDLTILVQPMYSKQELNADSNYVVYTSLIRAMKHARPDWHWVVIFPDAKSGYKYEDDGFFKLPNVSRVPQRISPRKMSNAVSFDGPWYDALMREIGFDLVWCNLVEVADKIKRAGAGTFELKGRPVVVAAHNYTIHDSLPYPFEAQAHVAYAQVGGALFADYNVFNSEHCTSMFIDTAKKWLRRELVEEIITDRSTKINYGTLEPSLRIDESRPRNDVPIIAYNHRLQAYKNFKDTFELLASLWESGVKFKVRYMNNTNENIAQIARYPFVEVVLCATRDEYLAALRECDLNVTNSQHETFCIAAIESMALGQPLIAPHAITFPEITGFYSNGYPYLFHTIEEQRAMLELILTDEGERAQWGAVVSEHVRSSFNQTLWAERYAALFERLTDFHLGTPDDVRDWVRGVLAENSGVRTREFYNLVANKQVAGRIPFSNQSLPPSKLVRLVRELGGRIKVINGQQRVYTSEET